MIHRSLRSLVPSGPALPRVKLLGNINTICLRHFSSTNPTKTFNEKVREEYLAKKTSYGNVTEKILELAGRELHKQPNHPLGIMRFKMQEFFLNESIPKGHLHEKKKVPFMIGDSFSPIVSVKQNFEDLLIPKDHVSRKRSDTYFVSEDYIMRPHATANERNMFEKNAEAFLIFGKFKKEKRFFFKFVCMQIYSSLFRSYRWFKEYILLNFA